MMVYKKKYNELLSYLFSNLNHTFNKSDYDTVKNYLDNLLQQETNKYDFIVTGERDFMDNKYRYLKVFGNNSYLLLDEILYKKYINHEITSGMIVDSVEKGIEQERSLDAKENIQKAKEIEKMIIPWWKRFYVWLLNLTSLIRPTSLTRPTNTKKE